MTKLQRLHEEQGQSPWLDNLTRDHLRSGQLATLVARGVRGVTANPTILAKAIAGSGIGCSSNQAGRWWSSSLRSGSRCYLATEEQRMVSSVLRDRLALRPS